MNMPKTLLKSNWLRASIFFSGVAALTVTAWADPLTGSASKVKVQPVIPLQTMAFSLSDVRLLPGPF